MRQRAGQKVCSIPGADWGTKIIQPTVAVAGDWWDNFGAIGCCVGAWQAVNVIDYVTSLLDLSGNGNNLVEINGAPGWNILQGWSNFNGVPTSLDTGLTPAADQSWSMIIQYTNAVANNLVLCGAISGGNAEFFLQPTRGGTSVAYANGGRRVVAPTLLAGNICVAGNQGYRNGIPDGAAIGVWGNPSLFSVYIGAYNAGFFPGQAQTDALIRAVALYDCTLNAAQVAAVAANMAAL